MSIGIEAQIDGHAGEEEEPCDLGGKQTRGSGWRVQTLGGAVVFSF